MSKLGEATVALGQWAAPHIKKQGDKLLPKSWQKSDDGGPSTIDDVANIAVGGVRGTEIHVYVADCIAFTWVLIVSVK